MPSAPQSSSDHLTWCWTPETSQDCSSERTDLTILSAYQQGLGKFEPESSAEAPPLSRSRLQKLIEEGKLTVDGRAALARSRLLPGQQVRLEIPAPRKLELLPEDRPLDILYQDEHIVVVNKAAGLTVHPSETQHDGTLVHALLHHIKDLSGIGGVLRPGIVHRLDKDTSGALVVSKTDAAHQKLVETFSAHRIERRYWALCYGLWRKPETKIESTIGRSPSDRKKMAIHVRDGRQAVTWVRGIENYGGYASWIEARLETGRTHQVRLHLNSTGNSLLGDPVYGTPNSKHQKWLALPRSVRDCVQNLSGQALHARVLGFDHPITGEALRFEAAPPQAWQTLLETLQKEANSST